KSKKDVSDSELETDVVDYSYDEADRKGKKLKIKAGLKRKRSGSDSSDSSEIDTKSIKLMISKLEKNVKKQESDEDSVAKKFKKKLSKKVKKEVSDEESLPKKGNKNLTNKVKKEESDEDSILKKGKKKEKQLTPKEAAHEEYLLRYSLFDLDEKETDHEFVRKWAGQFYPLELKKFRVNDIARKLIAAQEIDFLFKVNFLTLFTNTMDSISFEDDGNGDNVGDDDENMDDDENGDDDGGNVNNDANDCDGNGDEEDVNEGDKDPNGSNPSFGFSKISLEDFDNDSGPAKKYKAVEGNPTEQGTVVEGNEAEEWETMSTPENFTQWLEKNVDLVGEVIDSITAEYLYVIFTLYSFLPIS
nr:ELM2 domain-containing protein [Tanacetum cinerariifolium]